MPPCRSQTIIIDSNSVFSVTSRADVVIYYILLFWYVYYFLCGVMWTLALFNNICDLLNTVDEISRRKIVGSESKSDISKNIKLFRKAAVFNFKP